MTLPLRPSDIRIARSYEQEQSIVPSFDRFYARYGKRFFDIVLTLLLLPLALPLVALVALYVLITEGNPFYTQTRLGKDGRVFRIWKLRTMRRNADALLAEMLEKNPHLKAEWERDQKLRVDPRVTSFGVFLRKSSIDELPQLLNVLTGDMSLIGPRPMMLDQAALYGSEIAFYRALRPGISGLWQVTERNDADFQRRAQIDAEYARTLSFRNDLSIVIKTIKTVLRSTGH